MEKVLQEVLKKIKPSQKEQSELNNFSNKVISLIAKQNFRATLEGSLAKGTWISGDHDVDIFTFFDKKTPRPTLEKKGLEIGKKVAKDLRSKFEVEYAEHPYTRIFYKNYILDVVPCYEHKTLSELHSAVDRTPFHTEYVRKNLTEQQKDQVRLLKQFMKGVRVYSAKEKVHGFSGYLCELLVIYYGNFEHVIQEAAKNWKYGLILDKKGYYKPEQHSELRARFKHPLIVIDPIDKNRNVAAALDQDKFEEFIFACKEFLKKPSIKFFFPNSPKLFSAVELKKEISKHGPILIAKFNPPKLVEDILYSQLRSSEAAISTQFKLNEFRVLDHAIFSNSFAYLIFELEDFNLPKVKIVKGPPVKVSQKYQDKFVQKYEKFEPWVEKGKWYAEIPRKITNADEFLKEILKKPERAGVGKYIAAQIKKKYSLLDSKSVSKEYKKEFAKFFTTFLTKKKPWGW
ncbi:TPA: CCA tRNA nucleotidyltransferase [archaeon]|uniref:CCA-adding enzyme n=1 Tax=Candidatus Naiadarchaeum limnaeum TaxID=2756139 RepID=A0A832XM78_9ARCH|nr:CCA tRNA nucleotidyltransferase [Candidatus Naiadarchaeum limnaeum]